MKYVAILRGINVGGHRKILMADLKLLFSKLGFLNVTTYIQSGNVFFETKEPQKVLETAIFQAILNTYGFEVPVIVISAEALLKIKIKNPYLHEVAIERLHVTFLKEPPNTEVINKFKEKDFRPNSFEIVDKFVFLNIEGKYHKSKLSNNFLEKQLQVNATTRNWKTVSKLVAMCEA